MSRGSARAARAALALVFAGLPLFACGSILGIEKLPIVDPDATVDGAGAAADGGCEASSQMCGCVAHDFCDDFDVDGEALGARWSNELGVANPFTKGDASIGFTTQALSPPRAALTRTGEENSASWALLTQQLDNAKTHPGRAFAGFRYSVDILLDSLVVTQARGPLGDAGSAIAASVLHFDGPAAKGVALIVAPDGVYLLTAASLLNFEALDLDGGTGAIAPIFVGDVLTVGRTWLRVELVVADKQRAVRDGFTTCSSVADGFVVAATVGPARIQQACITLPAGVGAAWAEQPVVIAGGALFGAGSLVLRQDNLAFDFLAP